MASREILFWNVGLLLDYTTNDVNVDQWVCMFDEV